jgi:hypothetical protein
MTQQPVTFDVQYPDRLSRGHLLLKFFLGWLYVGLTHGIILYFLYVLVLIVTFIAFWAILFTGKYPKGMFDFVVGVQRWQNRVAAYMSLMRDEFPPFRLSS